MVPQIIAMKLVFATHNPNKLIELQKLVPPSLELISLETLGCHEAIPETENTLEGNARLKANYITNTYQLPCFADDTGLLVTSLNGEPGVLSARYAGPENNAQANMSKLLTKLEGSKDRSAYFKTVIALNLNGETHIFEGKVDGEITMSQYGEQGFGYDPIFKPTGYDQTFAQLPLFEKNKISHRGRAFQKLIAYLKHTNVTR
ncbi:XTP/dITP diphosphohydrolase [Maribacter sedimenticola]|uniref:dITP/XTP pyrophosphatase n=2 Tax=Maribacter sedimenticola TaxID=228956 RepID=A0ABY1SFW5_9FLAO|nr:XTP/dITP diphosphohydrolase [Maribacter sedimenticola]